MSLTSGEIFRLQFWQGTMQPARRRNDMCRDPAPSGLTTIAGGAALTHREGTSAR